LYALPELYLGACSRRSNHDLGPHRPAACAWVYRGRLNLVVPLFAAEAYEPYEPRFCADSAYGFVRKFRAALKFLRERIQEKDCGIAPIPPRDYDGNGPRSE